MRSVKVPVGLVAGPEMLNVMCNANPTVAIGNSCPIRFADLAVVKSNEVFRSMTRCRIRRGTVTEHRPKASEKKVYCIVDYFSY